MRRIFTIFLALVLMALCACPVLADSSYTAQNTTTVSSNGSCEVTLHVTVRLDEAQKDMTFPLPLNARNVKFNGINARTRRTENMLLVDISGTMDGRTGSIPVTFQYTLSGCVARDTSVKVKEGEKAPLVLTVPLLSGFGHTVESFSFSIAMPGAFTETPVFNSGYYGTAIDTSLQIQVNEATITGALTAPLKDHETLTMIMTVSETMFPQDPIQEWTAGFEDLGMGICAVLAIVYWIVFLRFLPLPGRKRPSAPDGINAGELGSALCMQGTDLTAMVIHWAQLGYILIHLDDNGRVILHKRMEMGNERTGFEVKTFRALFGKRRMIDGTGFHYAQLCRKTAALAPSAQTIYHRSSGNPNIFRLLAALVGVFGGAGLGLSLSVNSVFRVLLMVVLAVLGGVSSWLIQDAGRCLQLRSKRPAMIGVGLCLLWIVVGAAASDIVTAVIVIVSQLLAGLAAAYGGRRTELGKQIFGQITGLRRFMKSAPREELRRILKNNPDFFYALAPYALAMGVDQAFARRFGGMRQAACPYLTTGMDGHLTPLEWTHLLRDAAARLDERQRNLLWERMFGR